MTERLALVVAVGLAIVAGLVIGVAIGAWIWQGLRDLDQMFRL